MAMTGAAHSSTMTRPRHTQEHPAVVHQMASEPLVLVPVVRRVAEQGHSVVVLPMVAEALPLASRVLEPQVHLAAIARRKRKMRNGDARSSAPSPTSRIRVQAGLSISALLSLPTRGRPEPTYHSESGIGGRLTRLYSR